MLEYRKLIKYFIGTCLAIVGLISLGIWCYQSVYYGDDGLLSEATCLKYAEQDVFEKGRYPEVCPRSSYLSVVETITNTDADKASGFAFKFYPIAEQQRKCPTAAAVVDRRTGEVWITTH